MQIGKKAALMAAAAGAHGHRQRGWRERLRPRRPAGGSNGVAQSNACDSAIGAIITGAVAAPRRVLDSPPTVSTSPTAARATRATTATPPPARSPRCAALAPTGDIDLGSNCTNIAIADPPTVVVQAGGEEGKAPQEREEGKEGQEEARQEEGARPHTEPRSAAPTRPWKQHSLPGAAALPGREAVYPEQPARAGTQLLGLLPVTFVAICKIEPPSEKIPPPWPPLAVLPVILAPTICVLPA